MLINIHSFRDRQNILGLIILSFNYHHSFAGQLLHIQESEISEDLRQALYEFNTFGLL